MIKWDVLNRFTMKVQFTAEIDCTKRSSVRKKNGLALRWAVLRGADLRWADLRGAVLRGAVLRGAVLEGADLEGAVLEGADLRWAVLRGAVLEGADLRGAVLRGAVLRGADLRGAVLRGADLRGAVLRGAVLEGAVLEGADLRGAVLRGAVLRGAVLEGAVLEGAVLEGVPTIKDIHKKLYKAASQPCALDMSQWHHPCGTTHCRAGWVVHLAGEKGKVLEDKIGTPAAATLIYLKSDKNLDRVPDFYCGNDASLADMKRLAGVK